MGRGGDGGGKETIIQGYPRLFRTLKYRTPAATVREFQRLYQVTTFRLVYSQAEVIIWITEVFLRTGFR